MRLGRCDSALVLHDAKNNMEKFYFDEERRYRKTEHTTVISVQNIVTSKHATYLEFPPLGFEP